MKYILTPAELAKLMKVSHAAISKHFAQKSIRMGKRSGLPPDLVKDYLTNRGSDYSFRIISHINLRGGCGKTTAAVNLATRAKQYGHNVCLIDLDSQASATLTFGIQTRDDQPVFLDIYEDPRRIAKALVQVEDNLTVLPSSLNNGLLDAHFSGKPSLIKNAVANVCHELKSLGYSLVVIDCSPSLSAGVISTICASHNIVIPVGSDVFSLRGLELTLSEIKSICSTFNINEPDVRILFSKFDAREKISIEALTEIAQNPSLKKLLLPCFVRTCSEIPKAAKMSQTIFASFKDSTARDDYDMYTREVLSIKGGEAA